MDLDKIIRDAAGMPAGASERAVAIALADQLNARHAPETISHKAIVKWIARCSIPAKWLLRLAALPTPNLDLNKYA